MVFFYSTCGLQYHDLQFVITQLFGFRLHFVLGPQPARGEVCAVTRKVLEGAVSRGPWTRLLQAQVGPFKSHFRSLSI